jgi:hypothetical protein
MGTRNKQMTRGVRWLITRSDRVVGIQPKIGACSTVAQATPTLALRRWSLS